MRLPLARQPASQLADRLQLQIGRTTVQPVAKLSKEEARVRIRGAGLRATAPRVAVLRLLSGSDRPLSHGEVVEAFADGDWDQATLYRNLVTLAGSELARVVSRVAGITRYAIRDADEGPHLHPHFSCRRCGEVRCLHDAELSTPQDPAWRQALMDADLQVVGECPTCRRRKGRGSSARGKAGRPTKG